jgi:hypothetical protein
MFLNLFPCLFIRVRKLFFKLPTHKVISKFNNQIFLMLVVVKYTIILIKLLKDSPKSYKDSNLCLVYY